MKNLVILFLLTLGFSAHAGTGFNRTLEWQGVRFHLSSPNRGSVNILRIAPSGKITRHTVIKKEVFGTITDAEVADLNADGWPEVYVYATTAGSGSYGTVVGYAVNRGKSLSEITLPELTDDPVASAGYQGHDEFRIVESTLSRRFPVYLSGDSNAAPGGGQRQLHYRLIAGEAGWLLKLDDKHIALDQQPRK